MLQRTYGHAKLMLAQENLDLFMKIMLSAENLCFGMAIARSCTFFLHTMLEMFRNRFVFVACRWVGNDLKGISSKPKGWEWNSERNSHSNDTKSVEIVLFLT